MFFAYYTHIDVKPCNKELNVPLTSVLFITLVQI